MKRRQVLTAAAAASLSASTAVRAQQKAVVKIGWTTSDGAADPYAAGARAFKLAAERESGGSIDVQLFPNRQLGDERQMLEGMRFGTVDASVITNAVIAQIEPAFQVNDLPFLFANEGQAHKALDGALGQELTRRLAAKGIVALGYMEGGFRNMINNKRPVNTPADEPSTLAPSTRSPPTSAVISGAVRVSCCALSTSRCSAGTAEVPRR